MTTITQDSGNRRAPGTSLRGGPGEPGTLTAVHHADQSQTTQKDAFVTYPGAPRPAEVRPTPWGRWPTG